MEKFKVEYDLWIDRGRKQNEVLARYVILFLVPFSPEPSVTVKATNFGPCGNFGFFLKMP
jgi:hypothetical protein